MKKKILVQPLFFISASALAIISPILFLLSFNGLAVGTPISSQTHAASLLFGFVGALITGYLGGKLQTYITYLIFFIWLTGRLAELYVGPHWLTYILYFCYGIVIIFLIVPKFKSAKKWRNRSLAPLLTLIALFPLALFTDPIDSSLFHFSWVTFISLISCLMFFMGGRYLAPAIQRAFQMQGVRSAIKVQVKLEATLIVLLFFASISSTLHVGQYLTGILLIICSCLLFARLVRWKVYHLSKGHADIWGMVTGYTWLAIGLAIIGLELLFNMPLFIGIHCITLGALGSLSSAIILKTTQSKQTLRSAPFYLSIALISVATIFRIAAYSLGEAVMFALAFSAILWAVNYSLILVSLLKRHYG
jgi:uncharacterized protein involved in response to NO